MFYILIDFFSNTLIIQDCIVPSFQVKWCTRSLTSKTGWEKRQYTVNDLLSCKNKVCKQIQPGEVSAGNQAGMLRLKWNGTMLILSSPVKAAQERAAVTAKEARLLTHLQDQKRKALTTSILSSWTRTPNSKRLKRPTDITSSLPHIAPLWSLPDPEGHEPLNSTLFNFLFDLRNAITIPQIRNNV